MAQECSALSVQWFVNKSTLNDADTFVTLWYQNVCKYFISFRRRSSPPISWSSKPTEETKPNTAKA